MPIPVSLKSRVPFVLAQDSDAKNPPTFYLCPMKSGEFAAICEELGDAEKKLSSQEEIANRVLRTSLRGWKDWCFPETGDAVPFEANEHGIPTDDTLAMLDFNVKIELMGRALSLNQVSKEAKGN